MGLLVLEVHRFVQAHVEMDWLLQMNNVMIRILFLEMGVILHAYLKLTSNAKENPHCVIYVAMELSIQQRCVMSLEIHLVSIVFKSQVLILQSQFLQLLQN